MHAHWVVAGTEGCVQECCTCTTTTAAAAAATAHHHEMLQRVQRILRNHKLGHVRCLLHNILHSLFARSLRLAPIYLSTMHSTGMKTVQELMGKDCLKPGPSTKPVPPDSLTTHDTKNISRHLHAFLLENPPDFLEVSGKLSRAKIRLVVPKPPVATSSSKKGKSVSWKTPVPAVRRLLSQQSTEGQGKQGKPNTTSNKNRQRKYGDVDLLYMTDTQVDTRGAFSFILFSCCCCFYILHVTDTLAVAPNCCHDARPACNKYASPIWFDLMIACPSRLLLTV